MHLKHNPLIIVLLISLFLVPAGVYLFNGSESSDPQKNQQEQTNSTANDLPAEEVAALTGHMETLEDKINTLNQLQSEEMERFKSDFKKEFIDDFSVKISSAQQEQESVINEFEKTFEKKVEQVLTEISQNDISANEVGDINDELPFAEHFEIGGADNVSTSDDLNNNQIIWNYPIGLEPDEKGVIDNLLPFKNKATNFASNVGNSFSDVANEIKEDLTPIPFGTIHRDSSIHNVTSLTALIGRIEQGGKTHDAYRFQLILSDNVLLANGFDFPEIKDALVTGYAIGDAAFSCVKGKVTSITFNFDDGRIYNQQGTFEEPLAEISDLWGNPCVKGKHVDDIEKYIAAQSIVGGIGMAGEVVAQNQRTITSSGNSVTPDVTGSAGKMVAGSMFSGAANSTNAILAKRYESYYEAVYVPPGQKVSMLFLEDIAIDYIPTNRKVRYEENSTAFNHLY